jgi:hypothetical protein
LGHLLPPRHVEFVIEFPSDATLTRVGADPLAEVITRVLTVPLRELYALLWRAGVLEIIEESGSPKSLPQPRS